MFVYLVGVMWFLLCVLVVILGVLGFVCLIVVECGLRRRDYCILAFTCVSFDLLIWGRD